MSLAEPCPTPGCLRPIQTEAGLCLVHAIEWARQGERPYLRRRNIYGQTRERIEVIRVAAAADPGFLWRHVNRLFDDRMGPPDLTVLPVGVQVNLPPGYDFAPVVNRASRFDREQAAMNLAANRAAARDNAAYRRRRSRERARDSSRC